MIVVLAAVVIVSGIALLLAAALLVAERWLVRYGPCRIDVNAGARRLEVRGGDTLLNALKSQGVFIPSACGGRATCAFCKVKVPSGAGPIAPTELPLLAPQELRDQIRISCQVKVRNNLAVEIPPELFSVRQYRGVLERMRDLTHDIKELRIRLVDPPQIEFVAGQYVQLEAPAYGSNPEPVYRAYSISSPPADEGHIELIIRLVPQGICTTWVFTRLKEGQEVLFNGPYGGFRLSEAGGEMVWIAGGSGMAPFWSILRHMKERGIARDCTFFFGAVGQRDLFYLQELEAMAQELPWFHFVPALSGQDGQEGWAGERGLITEVVERHVADGAGKEAYLCGSAGMINASVKVLTSKGIPEDRIFYDKFN